MPIQHAKLGSNKIQSLLNAVFLMFFNLNNIFSFLTRQKGIYRGMDCPKFLKLASINKPLIPSISPEKCFSQCCHIKNTSAYHR